MKKSYLIVISIVFMIMALPNALMARQVDIFILMDATGDMGSQIAIVKNGFLSTFVPTVLDAIGPDSDVVIGIGSYRDEGEIPPYLYKLNQGLTSSYGSVQTSLNNLSAAGGGDAPEAQLYALQQIASTTTWREGSTHVALWIGNASGHDPSNGITEANATAALQATNVIVEAISINDGLGIQGVRIAEATGGYYFETNGTGTIQFMVNGVKHALNLFPLPGDLTSPVDCDVDGSDLAALIANTSLVNLATFAQNFGKNTCQ